MKADPSSLALRLETALFLFSLTVTLLYLMGAAQSFTDETLHTLFLGVKWLSWAGLLVAVLGLVPWSRQPRHLVAAIVLGVGFLLLFVFVLLWETWLYPSAGNPLW